MSKKKMRRLPRPASKAALKSRLLAEERPNRFPATLGVKLRHSRIVRGMTLKMLAGEANCSESMLSRIESNKATPSFATLHRIATALGTNISELYSPPSVGAEIVSRAGERPIIVTDKLRTGKGIQMERLIPYSREHLLQGNVHMVAPGGRSEPIVHAGEEIGYVLEGEIELVIDGTKIKAKRGDSFHFRSELPHWYRNVGAKQAKVLWINTPPTF